jgi:amino acid transporter
MAAAETRNPRRSIPMAIKRVYFCVLVLYIGGVFIIGLLVPSNAPSLNSTSSQPSMSPFVTAFEEAGIKVLPSVRYGSERPLAVSFEALTLLIDH